MEISKKLQKWLIIALIAGPSAISIPGVAEGNSTALQSSNKNNRQDQALINASDKARDRAFSLLREGKTEQAIKFVAQSLHSRNKFVWGNAFGVLHMILTLGGPKAFTCVAPLMENSLAQDRYWSYEQQSGTLLLYLWSMYHSHGSRSSFYTMKQAIKLAAAAKQAGHLSENARSFCTTMLLSKDQWERFSCMQILLVGVKLGGLDRAWSLNLCRHQLSPGKRDHKSMWDLLYRTMTGK